MKVGLVFLVLLATVGLSAAQQAGKPINAKCPVKPEKRPMADITTNYKGWTIAFCCEECRDAFGESPAECAAKIPELKALLALSPVNEFCPVVSAHPEGMRADAGFVVTISGKIVGFCSAGCRNKFSRAPESYMVNLPEVTGKRSDPKKEAEKADKPPPTGPCDLKRIVKGPYCAQCKRDLAPEDLRRGACKRCESKPELVEYCVKMTTPPPPAEGEEARPGLVEDRARVTYQCPTCTAKADRVGDLKHTAECKALLSGVKKICSKSGTAPHATDK